MQAAMAVKAGATDEHTVDELKQLIAAKTAEIQKIIAGGGTQNIARITEIQAELQSLVILQRERLQGDGPKRFDKKLLEAQMVKSTAEIEILSREHGQTMSQYETELQEIHAQLSAHAVQHGSKQDAATKALSEIQAGIEEQKTLANRNFNKKIGRCKADVEKLQEHTILGQPRPGEVLSKQGGRRGSISNFVNKISDATGLTVEVADPRGGAPTKRRWSLAGGNKSPSATEDVRLKARQAGGRRASVAAPDLKGFAAEAGAAGAKTAAELGGKSTDPNGMEVLIGEDEQAYLARQKRLQSEAKARMAAKFGGAKPGGHGTGLGAIAEVRPGR